MAVEQLRPHFQPCHSQRDDERMVLGNFEAEVLKRHEMHQDGCMPGPE